VIQFKQQCGRTHCI